MSVNIISSFTTLQVLHVTVLSGVPYLIHALWLVECHPLSSGFLVNKGSLKIVFVDSHPERLKIGFSTAKEAEVTVASLQMRNGGPKRLHALCWAPGLGLLRRARSPRSRPGERRSGGVGPSCARPSARSGRPARATALVTAAAGSMTPLWLEDQGGVGGEGGDRPGTRASARTSRGDVSRELASPALAHFRAGLWRGRSVWESSKCEGQRGLEPSPP